VSCRYQCFSHQSSRICRLHARQASRGLAPPLEMQHPLMPIALPRRCLLRKCRRVVTEDDERGRVTEGQVANKSLREDRAQPQISHQQSGWARAVRQRTWVGTTRRAVRCGRFGETALPLFPVRLLRIFEAVANATALRFRHLRMYRIQVVLERLVGDSVRTALGPGRGQSQSPCVSGWTESSVS
jgi:hypothetical protein